MAEENNTFLQDTFLQDRTEAQQRERVKIKDEMEKLEAEKDAALNEAKAPIIIFLVQNSKGAFATEDLQKLPLEVLKKLKGNFADAVNNGYDAILAERERQRKEDAKAKWGSDGTGVYDSETGKWKGGLLGDEE